VTAPHPLLVALRAGARWAVLPFSLATGPALADHAPCLTLLDDIPAYVAAFGAQGWRQPEPAEWTQALETLAQAQVAASAMPEVDGDAALQALIAQARSSYVPLFQQTEVLVKGDDAVSLRIDASDAGKVLTCLVAGPALPEVALAIRDEVPNMYGDISYISHDLTPPEGASALTVGMTHADFTVGGRTDFRGTDAIFVTLTKPDR
jgi:hypothetical protein